MPPPEWDAAPIVAPLAAGLALIIPALLPPRIPLTPPLNPPAEAPRAIVGAGMECGAITAWGMELRRAILIWTKEELGARRDAGAPVPRAIKEGADWARPLAFAGGFARNAPGIDWVVETEKLGGGTCANPAFISAWAKGMRTPARIAPLALWFARITVDGIAAS